MRGVKGDLGDLHERLEAMTERLPDLPGCWLWTGAGDGRGYGAINIFQDGKWRVKKVHRVGFALVHGQLAKGVRVLHRCDTPACWNPAHLFSGSQADNMRDCVAKRRHAFGERNGNALLTTDEAKQVRRLAQDGIAQRDIAERFGIGQSHVSHIKAGRLWNV